MKYSILAILPIICSCASVDFSTVNADGNECRVEYRGFFRTYEGISAGVCGAAFGADSASGDSAAMGLVIPIKIVPGN